VNSPNATAKREIWNKVRWINIAGVSWDVISALAIRYNLHPLAIEDVLHARRNARSKADYYTRHLFIHVLTHKLGKQEDDPEEIEEMMRTDEPVPMSTRASTMTTDRHGFSESGDEADAARRGQAGWFGRRRRERRSILASADGREGSGWTHGKDLERAGMGDEAPRRPRLRDTLIAARRAKVANEKAIDELKKGFGRVCVDVASAWIFLFRDGELESSLKHSRHPLIHIYRYNHFYQPRRQHSVWRCSDQPSAGTRYCVALIW
jgi:Mg2+ and Co2+ transporter CorA